ncbi:type I phosphomannose isomerase catalytic subunit [Aequorivita marina]|uniref:type I phosphomannose isomerase catalytic subunit n=1 Tax=Aequorivita marina TaxID=3073654 RepID=UPI0028752B20|nr:type I phosphomannose isomerase catalytic subunit [Aequorivita sp. S2608]MDS1298180.1 mannose-6-phosphate isomerase [Aequorivita sp. S2608]
MNVPETLYPLKFRPILKEKIWGGEKLKKFFSKNATGKIGESWEISGLENNASVVTNGSLKGKTLPWVLRTYKEKLVGDRVYRDFGNNFPLLFKFIDAQKNLSVQVHPDDALAKERHNSFGKTEMWYILNAEKDAKIILGFNENIDQERYLNALSKKQVTSILNSQEVKKGDAFILHPGTVHAIGAGVLLAEIQQTSDITYRIYDWDRPDVNGKMRQLHNDLALEAIDFSPSEAKLSYSEAINTPSSMGSTVFFSVNKLKLSKDYVRKLENLGSFTVYMCLEGSALIQTNHFSENITKGETILIPAQVPEIKISTNSASFLEVFIP